jgi:hypothetical protein
VLLRSILPKCLVFCYEGASSPPSAKDPANSLALTTVDWGRLVEISTVSRMRANRECGEELSS